MNNKSDDAFTLKPVLVDELPAVGGNVTIQSGRGWKGAACGEIRFQIGDQADPCILRLASNGDIFVHGKLVERDVEVTNALRQFMGALLKDV